MNWHDTRFTVIDTETTGFTANDRIVELSFLEFLGGKVLSAFTTLVNPGFPIPVEVSKIHGIEDSDVKNAPRFEEIVPVVCEWLAERTPLLAHNADFDIRMLSQSMDRRIWDASRPVVCTMQYAKYKHPVLSLRKKGHKVRDLAEFFGVPFDETQAHGAEYDARVTGTFAPMLLGHADLCDASLPLGKVGTQESQQRRRW